MASKVNYPLIIKLGIIGLSLIVYLVSLFATAYEIPNSSDGSYPGFACLLLGWMSLFTDPVLLIPWFSNILYFVSIPLGLFRKTGYFVIPVMAAAILMTIPSFFVSEMMVNEGGTVSPAYPREGIIIWISSYCILLVALFIPARRQRNKEAIQQPPAQEPVLNQPHIQN